MQGGTELKKQLGTRCGKRDIPQFVEDDELVTKCLVKKNASIVARSEPAEVR